MIRRRFDHAGSEFLIFARVQINYFHINRSGVWQILLYNGIYYLLARKFDWDIVLISRGSSKGSSLISSPGSVRAV